MFRITGIVKFDGFKQVPASSLKWNRHVDNISDTATIVLPAICKLKKPDQTEYYNLPTGQQIQEGTKVSIYAGYDGNATLRFTGFVKRINFKVPVEFECEGYAYQLRKKMFSKAYSQTTVRKILEDIIEGTDILLSDAIPAIPIPKVVFKNMTGIQVLEYLKEKCLLTVYFNYNILYCGLRAGELKSTAKLRLNWNVIKDDQLLFNADKEFAQVNIRIEKRTANGHKIKGDATTVKSGNIKVKRVSLIDNPEALKAIAEEEKKKLNNRGYSGKVTCFLVPFLEPGMTADIIDKSFAERNGNYFIEGVEGSVSPTGGGRQIAKIGFSLGQNTNNG